MPLGRRAAAASAAGSAQDGSTDHSIDITAVSSNRAAASTPNSAVQRVNSKHVDQVVKKGGNERDARDMTRMGREQEMQRNFKYITIFGFSAILMCSWESYLATMGLSLKNGGPAGMVWTWLAVWFGYVSVYLSMSEMASMAPTTGGQYHWVSEFSPRRYQRFLSYVVGWLGVLGWQTLNTSVAFQAGTEIQALIILNSPDYVPQPWHGTMLVMAVMAFAFVFNTLLATRLHLVEAAILVLHFYGFFCILIPLWTLSPRTPSEIVWTRFDDPGWNNQPLSAMIGMLTAVLPLLGADASVHMAEELHDAAYNLPRSIISSIVVNGAMGWIMVITVAYCMGNYPEVLQTPTGYPFVQIFYNSTGSFAATNAMTAIIIIMATFSCVTITASASRQMFAFARDGGLPFSALLSQVKPGPDIPLNAVFTSMVISCLLSLVNIGSTIAYNQIVSLGTGTLMVSYIVCVGCFIWRRLARRPMLFTRFSLGWWGLPINAVAMVFLTVIFVISFFPQVPVSAGLTAANMNWAVVVFVGVAVWGMVYYFFWARHNYAGPVVYVRRLEE